MVFTITGGSIERKDDRLVARIYDAESFRFRSTYVGDGWLRPNAPLQRRSNSLNRFESTDKVFAPPPAIWFLKEPGVLDF